MFAPPPGVPLPGGRPSPSGMTSMSHALISAAVAARPNPNRAGRPDRGAPCFALAYTAASAATATPIAAARRITPPAPSARRRPRAPARPDVVEVVWSAGTAHLAELGERGLQVARLVHRAAHEHRL